ncbi:hypothetical protein U9M48_037500 [Paspalum notatum var. saurae]|uniref:F-box associated domain-containing protein n=1 Tax=Paspalum notatum var. saurae TaxID=547442 RepID=A0AAQ3X9C6_PASNO
MGQITLLPDGPEPRRRPGSDCASFGLGYDARTRSHKVVRLLYHDSRPAGCDIYDVGGAGSAAGHWRPAASGAVPPERVRMNQMGVFADGHLHWVTFNRPNYLEQDDDDVMNRRMILAELSGKLCAVHLSTRSTDQTTTTMTVWGKSVEEGWGREHVIQQLEQWPEFSPRSAEELPVPVAVDPRDGGRILLDTGKALGYYDTRTRSFETVYSIKSKRLGGDHCHADDDMFFTATLAEDSLFRPCDRVSRLW